jgi:hypothetical protein
VDTLEVGAAVDDGEDVVPGGVDLDLHAAGQPGSQFLHERGSPLAGVLVGLPPRVGRNDRQDVVAHGLTRALNMPGPLV